MGGWWVGAVIVMTVLVSVVAVAAREGEVLGEVAGMAEVVTDVGSTEC